MAKSQSTRTKSTSGTVRKYKPSYKKIILKALLTSPHSARKGTSMQYIQKFIQERYETPDETTVRRYLSKRLKEMRESREIVMVRRSYRLTPAMKKKLEKGGVGTKSAARSKKATTRTPKTAKKSTSRTARSASGLKTASRKRGAAKGATRSTSSFSALSALDNSDNSNSGASLTEPPSGFIWQYYHDGFHDYQIDASEAVEQVYQNYLEDPGDFDVRQVKSGMFHYMVDFKQFTQQNVDHPAHTVRRIRRVAWTGPTP